jgi:hypothetical protein
MVQFEQMVFNYYYRLPDPQVQLVYLGKTYARPSPPSARNDVENKIHCCFEYGTHAPEL